MCLCSHLCPVRAYRRFLTLNLEAPPIRSGTPHLGFFIHLWEEEDTSRVTLVNTVNYLCDFFLILTCLFYFYLQLLSAWTHTNTHCHTSDTHRQTVRCLTLSCCHCIIRAAEERQRVRQVLVCKHTSEHHTHGWQTGNTQVCDQVTAKGVRSGTGSGVWSGVCFDKLTL